MQSTWTWTLLTLAAATSFALAGPDPKAPNLISPELVLKHGGKIGLTLGEMQAIEDELRDRKARYKAIEAKHQEALKAFYAELGKYPADEAKVLQQLDAALQHEAELKRMHVSASIVVRNQLTEKQVNQLRELAQQEPKLTEAQQKMVKTQIQPKIETLKQAMQRRGESGNPPPPEFEGIMAKFQELMSKGKVEAALETLDTAMKMID